MTHSEATAIGAIIAEADGGCPSCVKDMVQQFNAAFPEFVWRYDKGTYIVSVEHA